MIKTKVNNEYKDIVGVFGGGTLQKEIIKIWSREAGTYVYESSVEYTGPLPITITANGDALIDYRIYGASGGVGEPTENLLDYSKCESGAIGEPGNIGHMRDNAEVSDYIDVSGESYVVIAQNRLHNTKLTDQYMAIGCWDENYAFISNSRSYKHIESTVPSELCTLVKQLPSGTKYVRANFLTNNNHESVESVDAMIILGSDIPTSYIPYGYKLPMTAYKQELMVTNDMLDQSNWVLSPRGEYDYSFFMYFDITDFISKEECDAKVYKNFTDGYVPQKLVVAITNGMFTLVDKQYRILNNFGNILNKKFDFLSWDKIYLCIGYGDEFRSEATKQLKIDELFRNWKILIAPTSQTQNVPVYIGDTPLGEDEYVSYSDQKIYKMVNGALTPTDPPAPLPEIPTIDGTTVIDCELETKPDEMYVKYRR